MRLKKDHELFSANVRKIQTTVTELKSKINSWENELKTIKARVKVASTTKKLNKQIANVDSSNTVSLLERMKNKVAEEEALSDAYADISNNNTSIDDEINDALKDHTDSSISDSLAELKAKLKSDSST